MTHEWHETYHRAHTPAHHLDPRSKLFVGLLFVGFVLFADPLSFTKGLSYGGLLLGAFVLARPPAKTLFQRILGILPFALLMLVSAAFTPFSWEHFAQVVTKALLSIGAMTLVSLTTPFPDMLRALEKLHLPKLLILFLAFLFRYGAVLRREALQLERGWKARYFGRLWTQQWTRLGHILAALLIRSYERAERIYAAMLARGFSGQTSFVRVLHFTPMDGLLVAVSLVGLSLVQWGIPR